jgi:hypothetical protein
MSETGYDTLEEARAARDKNERLHAVAPHLLALARDILSGTPPRKLQRDARALVAFVEDLAPVAQPKEQAHATE